MPWISQASLEMICSRLNEATALVWSIYGFVVAVQTLRAAIIPDLDETRKGR